MNVELIVRGTCLSWPMVSRFLIRFMLLCQLYGFCFFSLCRSGADYATVMNWASRRLGPWVCCAVAITQPFYRNVGVQLRGGQGSVTQNFLHSAQIGTAVEEMSGR